MKFFYILIIFLLLHSCSFDNKTGIWKNDNIIAKDDNDVFKEFKTLTSSNKIFDTITPINENFKFQLTKPINNLVWKDVFYNQTNNFKNFKYNNLNQLIFKSKKISKYKSNNFILFEDNNIITSDQKGNIIIFSVNESKIIAKFNFYKKRYKKIKKVINFVVENNVVYIADNIGYLYAFDYKTNKILWAKNYKIPFRSNLKISENKLITANQNNILFFFDMKNGDILSSIPTEETIVKNKFVNNISSNSRSSFFLNTYGSLYSLDNKNMKIQWFLNLNQSLDLNPSNLFMGSQIIASGDIIAVTSNNFTYIINAITGTVIYKKNFTSIIKPIIVKNYLFLITNNNFLISMNLLNGNIIYANDVNQKVAEYLNTKKKKLNLKIL